MKLWHDDIRRPPDASWLWARTNAEAIAALRAYTVEEISLDHDLGLERLDPDADAESVAWAGRSQDGSGLDLVEWMCQNDKVPARLTIHSWNPGARRMVARLAEAGHSAAIAPFQGPLDVEARRERAGLEREP